MNYKEIRLYEEIKTEMVSVLEAEDNSRAWKQEARNRMKDVDALITAARKVNKDVEIDKAELVKQVREELAAEALEEAPDEDEAEEETAE